MAEVAYFFEDRLRDGKTSNHSIVRIDYWPGFAHHYCSLKLGAWHCCRLLPTFGGLSCLGWFQVLAIAFHSLPNFFA